MIDQSQARGAAVYAEGARALRAITAEIGDYSERLLADGTATASQLVAARSIPEWMNVMAAFSQRTLQENLQQMTRIAGMYAEAVGDQTRAVQALLQPHRV